ncbi:MAG: uroporphyrinogen-III synthase [Candidatus Promineifilaceae bacterium]|nr:uroporphyrinogen-III synthase [Candidatus Promineifilaceae bacterium]
MTAERQPSAVSRKAQPSGLADRFIINTRAPHQASTLTALLTARGARPVAYPCIDIAPPADTTALDAALRAAAAGHYDWLLLTSANTARVLGTRLAALDMALDHVPVAAVGPKTARAVQNHLRIDVSLVADEFVAESLAAALGQVDGQRLLLPQSALARPTLAQALRSAGAVVTVVVAYETVLGQGGEDVPALLAAGRIDAVLFTSASTVDNFCLRLQREGGRLADLAGVCLAAIGPITAKALHKHDLKATVVPNEYTLPRLVSVLDDYFRKKA